MGGCVRSRWLTKRGFTRLRDAEAAAIGYETLRFDYSLVVFDWPRVERAVLARLDAIRRHR